MNRDIYQHYQGYELLIRQLEESITRFERNYIPQVYSFVGPDKQKVIQTFIGNQVPYQLFGGYDEALRKRLVIGDDLRQEDYVSCVSASFNPRFNKLTHRDIAGAVYNLGIDEETFGDMWIEDDKIYLYTTNEMASFICDNLTQVHHCTVRFSLMDHYPAQKFQFKTTTVTVSSYRLDKILSAVIRKSREKVQQMIKAGLININFQTIEDCDHVCHNCDILSVRGYGRYKIGEEIAITRSGNYVIEINQFV